MKYLSVCSGVEAASQAWQPLGWEAVAFSEIEPFPCAVLASRFPNVPNLGDMSRIHYDLNTKELYNDTTRIVCRDGIDLLVGGTPCQSFSVAGKRAGLEGASGLAYHYARLIGEIQPRWFVWENVPGALSSVTYGDQRDFNFLLQQFGVGGNADLGVRYNCCWRVLDTQYVRVEPYPRAIPQRRRRVFVVGHLATDGGGGCEVLLEQEGVRGNPPPRRVKGQGTARDIEKGVGGADGEKRGVDLYNHQLTNDVGAQLTAEGGAVAGHSGPSVIETQSFDVLCSQNIAHCEKAYERAETCRRQDSCGVGVAQRTAVSFLPTNTAKARSLGEAEEVAPTMARGGGESGNKPSVAIRTANTHANGCGVAYGIISKGNGDAFVQDEFTPPLQCGAGQAGQGLPAIAIGIGRDAFNSGANAQMGMSISREVMPPQTAVGGGCMHDWRTTKGEDVMPTLDTRLAAQVDKQMERNGSYLCGPLKC